ncbi:MAG: hypothetical protein A2W72_01380 [Burkholderiales bacterium RIFCSPLOWO2_12_67_14]|nr:MAG: hypothetical protein A3I64_16875 [Burkholderiales bacterium RIFCSPLOWO2_02_FULL_67_64]OGB35689.1 MAG: hypothetical protein A3E51_13935 [Burkholderiales bacterium RIFCSPHIGHO2_12_FULL_67_38]OGB46600.1 MAG: hypothetical protein A2W72_01380 [Burkholderiales bacterium RIFCSPLOWO2_12_67_14]OGB96079.1 MAG: hypothetical protein A3G82_08215 [Burkholderiales bacterium RIFCSPLOWO2_12_FULL_67_210]
MNQQPRIGGLAAAALAALSLSACAADPKATATAPHVTHNCKPQETVGFSCELPDRRVLSLCGSPGFNQFKGAAQDNPGYAYVAIGTQQGQVQFTYPPNPEDYKKHMYFWVSISAWPHMFVATDKGSFVHFSLDIESPADANPENAPQSWPLSETKGGSLCAHRINRDHLDPFMAQMIKKADWERSRDKSAGQ